MSVDCAVAVLWLFVYSDLHVLSYNIFIYYCKFSSLIGVFLNAPKILLCKSTNEKRIDKISCKYNRSKIFFLKHIENLSEKSYFLIR